MSRVNNLFNSFQNRSNVNFNPLVVTFVFIEIIFIIFSIVSFNNILNEELKPAKIAIDNYPEVVDTVKLTGDVGELKTDIFGMAIYRAVALNTTGTLKNSGAKVRENSVKNIYLDDYNFQYSTFLIDLPALQQSYRVIYRQIDKPVNGLMSVDDYNVIVICPREKEKIYDNFDCQDDYVDNVFELIVAGIVQHKDFDSFDVFPLNDESNGDSLSFEIMMFSDDSTEQEKEEAVEELARFLDSIGVDLDEYEYAITTKGTHLSR